VARGEIGEPDLLTVELETQAEYRKRPALVHHLAQGIEEDGVEGSAMDGLELGPGFGLGGLDEGSDLGRDQGTVHVVAGVDGKGIVRVVGCYSTGLIAPAQDQVLGDELLEGVFL